MIRRVLLILLHLVLLSGSARAATYWVAKTGSDSNSCATAQTEGTPKLTIAGGISCLQVAGDTLQVKTGTYIESISSLPTSGTSSQPITIRSKSGDAVTWRASDTNLDSHGGPLNIFDRSWITINGFTFNGSVTHSTIRFVNSGNIETVQRVGIVITNNTFSSNGNNGKSGTAAQRQSAIIRFDKIGHQAAYAGATTSEISNNTFTDNFGDNIVISNTSGDVWIHDNTSTGNKSSKNVFNGNYYQTAFLNSGSDNRRLLVEDNTVSDMDAAGDTHIDNGLYEASGIRLDSGLTTSTIRRNTIHDINYGANYNGGLNQGYGLHPEARINGNLFEENIIYRIGFAGIRVGAESVGAAIGNTFRGNVVFDCTNHCMLLGHADDLTMENNIFMNAGNAEIVASDQTAALGGHVFRNNLYFNTGRSAFGVWNQAGNYFGVSATLALAAWASATGETNGVSANPTFVDTSDPTYDFHLQVASPAIDAGFNGVDIGAYPDDTPPVQVEYFVNATGGSNSNSCTAAKNSATPKLTIGGASGGISCLQSGEMLTIRTGTYVENDIGLNAPTIPSGSSDTSRTKIRGAPGETVTIRPSGGTGALFIYSKSFVTVEDIIFDATNVAGAGMYVGRQTTANTASTNITLDGVEIKNAPASGVYFGHNQDTVTTNGGFKALNCLMHDNGAVTSGHGIYSQTRGALIDGGAYYSNTSHGVHIYSHGTEVGGNAWTGTTDTIVRNLETKNNGTAGIGLYNGTNVQAYNNLVHNNGALGIAVRFGCNQCKVYNNTLYSNGTVGGLYITSNTTGMNSSSNVQVVNNIFFQNDGLEYVNEGINTTISNSLCDGAPTSPVCAVNESNAASIFTNIAGNDFSLVPTSPAINTGFNLSSFFSTDYAGNTRIQPFDIGAYEFIEPTETISLVDPNGGEAWVKTTLQTIVWTSNSINDVRIRLDRDGNGSYEETIVASTTSDGTYDWTPGGVFSATAKIEVCDAEDNTPCDTSDAVFTIADTSGGTLTKIISDNTTGSFVGDIPGTEDTRIRQSSATTNLDNSALTINKETGDNEIGLIKFTGLSQIPTNVTVNSVTLGMNLLAAGTGTSSFDFRRLKRTWVENQATYNAYSTGNSWQTAGGTGANDRDTTPVLTFSSVGTTLQFYSATDTASTGGLRELTENWISGATANQGLHIEQTTTNPTANPWVFSHTEGTNGVRPYLSVTYTVLVGTITVTQPFSGGHYFAGDSVPVRWQTSNVSGGLNIYLSRDGGINYTETLATDFPFMGVDFNWTVTSGVCGACMIKVVSVNDTTVEGISAAFRVGGTKVRIR